MGTYVLRGGFGPRYEARTKVRRDRRGSGDSHGMQARVAKLEASVDHVQRDIVDLKVEVRELRSELRTEVDALRSELRTEVGALRSELRTEVASLRCEARTDFRLLFGAILTVAVGLASLMAKSFGWL